MFRRKQKAVYQPRTGKFCASQSGVGRECEKIDGGKSLIEGARHILNDSPRGAV
jgi:hypothetical protein